ncbi:MAG: cytochrome c oxidase subunit II [Verrucomicrobiota bacterium]
MSRLFLALPAALSLALAAAATAAAGNGGLAPVPPVSPNADAISQTYWLILIVTGVIFVLVEGALILFAVRFRRGRRNREQEGPQLHGATKLETASTIVPVLILAGIAAFVFVKLPTIKDVPPAKAEGGALQIRVGAQQYYWQFEYPQGQVAFRTMVVPLDRVVELTVVSSDVIHSWWVPALGGKIDAIPGRTNHTWFKAEKLGHYEVRCAELCGLEHAHMTGWVDVVTPSAYSKFLADHTGTNPVVGKEIFDGVCATCHGSLGQGDYGPALTRSAVVIDPKALEPLLRNGGIKMPAVGATWNRETMDSATSYLKGRFGGG